jgi:hypothetical protein
MSIIIDWLRRPYLSVGAFRFYLWSGEWSWWDRPECFCHSFTLYVGPFGFEVDAKPKPRHVIQRRDA